jgi:DNA-binding transcriptional ArsR family regulator
MTETKDLPNNSRYLIFQALSHPTRVKILSLLGSDSLSFSQIKRELGMESSGQLQHHLQKLYGLIKEEDDGSYGLTPTGMRALEIYRDSEKSGAPLAELCCLPSTSELAHDKQISRGGTLLRLSIGFLLSAATIGIVVNALFPDHAYLKAFNVFGGGTTDWSWIPDAILFGFFGLSFLIASASGYPGCEITAIPNLFTASKRYCPCLITPFNVPNGHLLKQKSREKAG